MEYQDILGRLLFFVFVFFWLFRYSKFLQRCEIFFILKKELISVKRLMLMCHMKCLNHICRHMAGCILWVCV